jgi:hypothetical protein
MADISSTQSLAESLRWLDSLEKASSVKTLGAWPMGAVLEHLAQKHRDEHGRVSGAQERTVPEDRRQRGLRLFQVARPHEPWPGRTHSGRAQAWRQESTGSPPQSRLRQAIARFKRLQRAAQAALCVRRLEQGRFRAGAQHAHREPPGRDLLA